MAETREIALAIEVKGAEQSIKSVKDLKAAITALQNEAESSDIGSEQYKNAIEQLEQLNDKLKQVTQTEKQATQAAENLAKAEKEATKETQDLRKQFEVLEDELFLLAGQGKQNTKQFKDLTVQAATLNKKIDEVNSSLGGNETERAAMGFSKLKEGLQNLDFKSVKEGLTGIKTALAATGVMLIVMAISYLVANFDELSKGSGLLAKALQFVGSIIKQVTDGVMRLTDHLGLTNSALDEMGDATVKNAEKAKTALEAQTAEYDRQIAVAKAAGKSTVDLEIAKQEAIIATNKALIEQTIAYVKQGGILNDEKKKLLTEQLETIKTAVSTEQVITLTAEKEKNDKLKKLNEEAAKYKIDQDLIFKGQQAIDDEASYQLEVEKLAKLNLLKVTDQEQALLDKQAFNDQLLVLSAQRGEAELAQDKINEDKKKQLQQDTANAYLDIASASNDSMQSLSDAFFAVKNANLKKGSAAELKAAEQQFKINKALAISSAIISGIQGVVNALSAQSALPEPIATVLRVATAVGVGIAAVANVAKIASTKFNPGGGGGGGSAPTMPSAPPIPSHPTISTPENNTNKTTTFDETGKNLNAPISATPVIKVNATVGVDEITTKKDRVEVLEKQSTF